jgi:hypothetical protein
MEAKRGRASPVQSLVPTLPAARDRLGFAEHTSGRIREASDYLRGLAAKGVAEVAAHESRGEVFLDLSIEGVRFQAFAETDPFVAHKDYGGWCQLGVATIDRSYGLNGTNERWMVCKYGPMEGRIDLSMLSDAGRRAFAIAFGVPIGRHSHLSAEAFAFYASPALDGLIAWAKRRPRKFAAEPGVSSYLGDWKAVVTRSLAAEAERG